MNRDSRACRRELVERERLGAPMRRAGGQLVRIAGALGAIAGVALFVAAVVVVGRPIVEERAAASRPALTATPRQAPDWPGPVSISVFHEGREDVIEPDMPPFKAIAASLQSVLAHTRSDVGLAALPDDEARRIKAERTAVEVVYLGSGVSAEISMLIPLDSPASGGVVPILVGDGERYLRGTGIEAGSELAELRKALGVREPPPPSPPSEPTDPSAIAERIVPAPTTAASRAAIDDGAWEKLARSVTGVETILRPASIPDGLGPVSILKAEHSWFEVEYRAEGRRLYIGVGVFDPPRVDEKGEQRQIVVRGQPATLQIGDRANPKKLVIVWWDEPGRWSLSPADDSSRDRISYVVGAEGLAPEEVERVVASLRPEPRPALPTPASPPATPRPAPSSTPGAGSTASSSPKTASSRPTTG